MNTGCLKCSRGSSLLLQNNCQLAKKEDVGNVEVGIWDYFEIYLQRSYFGEGFFKVY